MAKAISVKDLDKMLEKPARAAKPARRKAKRRTAKRKTAKRTTKRRAPKRRTTKRRAPTKRKTTKRKTAKRRTHHPKRRTAKRKTAKRTTKRRAPTKRKTTKRAPTKRKTSGGKFHIEDIRAAEHEAIKRGDVITTDGVISRARELYKARKGRKATDAYTSLPAAFPGGLKGKK